MITEKMLELIILRDLIREFDIHYDDNYKKFGKNVYVDGNKILDRHDELMLEFIDPYVVDKA